MGIGGPTRRYDASVSSISDPGRPSRGDRKKVQRLIDAAYAAGTLSAAERALRSQRVDAAHTRGDLAMIARDLGASVPTQEGAGQSVPDVPSAGAAGESANTPSLGRAIDPQVLQSMRVGSSHRGAATGSTPPVTVNLAGFAQAKRTIQLVILVVVVAVFGFCGLGLFALIPAFMEGFNSHTSSPGSTPTSAMSVPTGEAPGEASADVSLHTAAGWKRLVSAIEQESGSTSVYDVVVYPTYAAVGLDGGKTIDRRLYRDGAWQDSFKVSTPVVGNPIDLRSIDPRVIAKLPAEAAQRLGVEHPTGSYFIVNAIPTDPKIMVYVQSESGSQYQAYALDGTPRAF